jgi:hypothetical protein
MSMNEGRDWCAISGTGIFRLFLMHGQIAIHGKIPPTSNERQIKSLMNVGTGLALFGLVCSFFG